MVRNKDNRLEDFGESLKSQEPSEAIGKMNDRALLERMDANIEEIKKLSYESQAELLRTRHAFLKGIFGPTEVNLPTTFIILNNKLPPAADPSDEEAKNKILKIVAEEDGSGVSTKTKGASLTFSADGANIDLEGDEDGSGVSTKTKGASLTFSADGVDIDLDGDLKEYRDQVDAGIKWAKRIKDIGPRVAAGEVGRAFDIIKEGISDLTVGGEMYLYLVDELTGEPVRADAWPLIITTPADLVPKLLPLMQVGIRAMCIYNGTAGLAALFGFPLPRVPKAWSKGSQELVELLKQESSVQEFGVVNEEVEGGTEEKQSVRGASLRVFVDFLKRNDPGLRDGNSGDFAGLQRIGDPEDGTALWTTLTDPVDIENALKKRTKQREEEQLKHNEHIKKIELRLRRSKSLLGDHATGKDLLGVLDEANAIADTISFKDLQLPFVVGIIGGWGSGKSFTYNLIRERLKEIQKYDLTDENFKKKFPYVGHIFLVKFDVWTFAKGNLWSSLMYRILTELNDQLDLEETVTPDFLLKGVSVLELLDEFTTSGERKYLAEAVKKEGVQEKIRKWNPSGGNITKALVDATISNYKEEVDELEKKRQKLHKVTVMKKQQLAWRDVTKESNAKILPEIKKLLKDAYEQHAEENPEDQVPQSVDAAMKGMKQWKGTLGWFKRYMDIFRAGRLSPLWFAAFLSSLILALVLPLVLKKIGAIATAIGPAVSGLFAKYHDAREKLKSAQEEISKVASEMHLDKEVLREALRAANEAQSGSNTNDEENQQEIIQELNTEINYLEDRIWLRKGDSLNKVVKDRVGSSNYEEHLGVVHQAQVDLKHISNAMLSNKDKFPRGDPRIVLFIDDLDRCPPKKVVETLEAVQLLVNTKLFVVVLAIDTQYVTLCLEDAYTNILDPKRHPSGLDYIEKIIQLPYRVPPIGNEHMKSYLQEQMNAKKTETRGPSKEEEESPAPEEVSNESKKARQNDDNQSPRQPNEKTPFLPDYINVVEATIDKVAPEPTKPAVAIPTEELDFTWEELEMLEDACLLSGVGPRSARRLVNVFKLMKVIWYRRDQDQTPDVDTPFELRMKKACVLILALCASKSKSLRLGMCKVLAKVEQTRSMPVGCDNLKDFIETLGNWGTGQAKNNLLTMIHDEKCSRILEKVVWGEDEKKWNLTRKDLRLLRSFSFVGEYSEPVDGDGIHHPSIDTRN
eukprot:scaffold25004_cov144-Skeletonema_dohrnii-CCMP3373.AAC.4